MADITMCSGGLCPKTHECYRYTATPNEFRQSYFVIVPLNDDGVSCDEFCDNKDYQRMTKIKEKNATNN